MKIGLIIIGVFCFATLTHAGTFLEAKQQRRSETFLTPEKLVSNLKASDFGKSLLNLLSLQFKTSGQLDDVNQLLNNLRTKLLQQQTDEDEQYTKTTEANNQIISDQTSIIAQATASIETATKQINDAKVEQAQLLNNQGILQGEKDQLTFQIAYATTKREDDAAAYAERVKDLGVLLNGLQKTLNVFQQATTGGNFNQDSVTKILGLLQNLQAAYNALVAQETQREEQAIQDFNDFLTRSQNRIADIDDQLQAISLELARLATLITQLQDVITAQTTTRNNAQALKDRTVQAQADLDSRYNSNKAVRTNQVELIASAVVALNSNSAEVQSYLNQA